MIIILMTCATEVQVFSEKTRSVDKLTELAGESSEN